MRTSVKAAVVGVFAVSLLGIAAMIGNNLRRASPLRVGIVEWPGFYPLVCAIDRGEFRKSGLDVSIKVFPDNPSENAAMDNGEIDIIGTTCRIFWR